MHGYPAVNVEKNEGNEGICMGSSKTQSIRLTASSLAEAERSRLHITYAVLNSEMLEDAEILRRNTPTI